MSRTPINFEDIYVILRFWKKQKDHGPTWTYVILFGHFCTQGSNMVFQSTSIICSCGGGIPVTSCFIDLFFYGPPPYARRKTWGTNVLTRNQPEVNLFFYPTMNTIKRLLNVYKIYIPGWHPLKTLFDGVTPEEYIIHTSSGFFLNPFLSFLKMVSTSSFILSSTVLHSLFRYWE